MQMVGDRAQWGAIVPVRSCVGKLLIAGSARNFFRFPLWNPCNSALIHIRPAMRCSSLPRVGNLLEAPIAGRTRIAWERLQTSRWPERPACVCVGSSGQPEKSSAAFDGVETWQAMLPQVYVFGPSVVAMRVL
jgi:hypothetical protein